MCVVCRFYFFFITHTRDQSKMPVPVLPINGVMGPLLGGGGSSPLVVHLAGVELFRGSVPSVTPGTDRIPFKIVLLGDVHRFFCESVKDSRQSGDVHLGDLLQELIASMSLPNQVDRRMAFLLEDMVGSRSLNLIKSNQPQSDQWQTECTEGLEYSLNLAERLMSQPTDLIGPGGDRLRIFQVDRRREMGIVSPSILYSLPPRSQRDLLDETVAVLSDPFQTGEQPRGDLLLTSLPATAQRWVTLPFLSEEYVQWVQQFRQNVRTKPNSRPIEQLLSETRPLLDFEIIYRIWRELQILPQQSPVTPQTHLLIVVHLGLFHLANVTRLIEVMGQNYPELELQRITLPLDLHPRIPLIPSHQLQRMRETLPRSRLRSLVTFIPLDFWYNWIVS